MLRTEAPPFALRLLPFAFRLLPSIFPVHTLQCKVLIMTMSCDVLIAGAGLAGLRCARLLSSRGLDVILADRRPSIGAPVHTTGIFVRKTWEDFPLPEEQLGPPIREVVLHAPSGKTLSLRARQDEFRVGRMSWLYLSMLEQTSRNGTRWLPSTRVTGIDGETVTAVRHTKTISIRARFVIGADGARSAVAGMLGLNRNRTFLTGIEEIVPSFSRERALHCFVDPRIAPGYIGWLANDGEEAHFGVAGNRTGWNAAAALERLRERIPFKLGRSIERRGGLIPVGGVLRNIACPRGLLTGDAAGAVSPLTAGGFDGAMRLSERAAETAVDWLSSGDPAVLRQYAGSRYRARFLTRTWMRRAMNTIESPWVAEAALRALRVAPFRFIAEQIFFARASFPDVPGRRTVRLRPSG
jgi:flavin-dependent dehydrogenase